MNYGGRRKAGRCNFSIGLTVVAALCLVGSSAFAQSAPDGSAPTGESAPQTPPPPDGAPAHEGDGQQTAQGAQEADCGCPKADPAVDQTVSEASSVIAANASEPDKICGLITPLVAANPCSAPDVIAAAGQFPEIAEKLAQCLSKIQSGLKKTSPESADTVAKVVSCASPAFQAAYSESLAPSDGGDGQGPGGADAGGPNASAGAGPTGGGGGFGPTSTFGSFGRFGSGPNTSSPPGTGDDPGSFGGDSVSPF